MAETLAVDGWTARHDRAAAAFHARPARGGSGRRRCAHRRDFALQRSAAFPAEFLRLRDRLGADAAKERAVRGVGPAGGGSRRYAGRFSFAGGTAHPEAGSGAASGGAPFGFGSTGNPDPLGSVAREPGALVGFEASLPRLSPDQGAD